jgi:PAS domain S-box-containing protein
MSTRSTARHVPDRQALAPAALAVVALVAAVAQYLVPEPAAADVANVSWLSAGAFAVLACRAAVRASIDADHHRRWTLLGLACSVWLMGEVGWTLSTVMATTPSVPSAGDLGWLAFAPLAMVAIHRLSADPPRVRLLVSLDVVAMVTVAATLAVVVFYETAAASELSTAGRVVALAFSSLYAGVAMTLLQALVRRVSLRRHPELVLLLLGTTLNAVAFFLWTPVLLDASYVAGRSPIDAMWTIGMLCLGGAALASRGRGVLPPRTARDLTRTAVLPAAGVLGLAALVPVLALSDQSLGQRLTVQAGLFVGSAALCARFLLLSRWHVTLLAAERHAAHEAARANAELARSSAQIRDLYDHAPCGYHSIDATGLILQINETELGWLGYGREEIVGRMRVPDLLTPASADVWRARIGELHATGELHDIEYDLVRRDGTTFPVSLSATVVRDDDGRFVMSRSTLFDVTDRRRDRNDLEAMASELRRSNSELQHFAYAASHDLAEPLRTIKSFGQMLDRGYGDRLDDKGRRFLGHVTEGAARMQRLIDSMLVYSRAGRAELAPEAVDVSALTREVVTSLDAAVRSRDAVVAIGELPTVDADVEQLAQVLRNLVGNALKFGGERTPHVAVTAAREPAAWRFTVADNGIGIEPRHAERIFQMFQRLHTRDEYEGTGIGLALCAKIVERHGGRIWVESEPGTGSRFHFTIADTARST